MKSTLLWRGVLILGVLALAVYLCYPPQEKINLGLDLQGGMHLVFQVETEDALQAETDADLARLLRDAEQDEKIAGLKGERTGDFTFVVSGASPESQEKLVDLANRTLGRWTVGSRGADRITFNMRADQVAAVRTGAVKQARQTIENRINQYGVAEPVIQEATNYRIVLQLPGVDDPQRVLELIKSTAFLEFRITRYPREGGDGLTSREAVLANFGGRLPDDLVILERDVKNEAGEVVGTRYYAVEKRRSVTGRDLSNARPSQGQFNEPVVLFSLTPVGSEAFADLTGSHIGEGLAIVLDGKIMSAPTIQDRIRDEGTIRGSFTAQEVEDLVNVLKSGALPADVRKLEERTVGPSLGRDSIRSGFLAGLIGTALVVLYMLIIYNLSGLNAVLALALNIVLLFGGLGGFNATLTLPGIAGVILTIGMAVDANVLIFERIREELRAGRTIKSSIDLGFEKALSAIIDSNVTTLIAAVLLFQFGTSAIKGFAVTLTIGLLASMFTAVFVSRWLFDLVLSRFQVKKLSI